jgi:hypothetical protein
MISHLKNSNIDRNKWDKCINNSDGAMPYACSWYLDAVSPEWEALVLEDYKAVMPLPAFKKYGFCYIATPIFLQQLGVFSPDGSLRSNIDVFLKEIPDYYKLIDLCSAQSTMLGDFRSSQRFDYELDLRESYDALWFSYSTDCRRNINISHRYQQDITEDVTPGEIIALFKSNVGRKAGIIRNISFLRLENLMTTCIRDGHGRILGVRSPKGKLLWSIFVIDACNRITLLVTAGSRKSREMKTGYHVIDHIIRQNAGSVKTLDFAGSSVPSIAVFMKSFGSIRKTYYRLYSNRLPWPVKYLK